MPGPTAVVQRDQALPAKRKPPRAAGSLAAGSGRGALPAGTRSAGRTTLQQAHGMIYTDLPGLQSWPWVPVLVMSSVIASLYLCCTFASHHSFVDQLPCHLKKEEEKKNLPILGPKV